MNSARNLVLHACGNLRQWIVAGVGEAPDERNRPAEFASRRPFRKAETLRRLDETVEMADDVLKTASPERLLEPRRIQGFETTAFSAIFHSIARLRGHAQEIVSMTRMQRGDPYRFEWTPRTPEEGAPEE